jgi:pimeloyl-ACP methyl ester carboxylesterase
MSDRRFNIKSEEGLSIRGNFDAPRDPSALVVIVHGFKGFKDWGFFPWLAERLCDRGFAVCRFNMSRSGIGENPESFERLDLFAGDTYSIQLADLRVAVAHAQKKYPALPTFLVGHSRGGGVALLGSESVPGLHGVVTWSAISTVDRWDPLTVKKWRADGFMDVINQRTQQTMRMSPSILDDFEANRERLDIGAAATRLSVPLLVIHGARDESVPVAEASLIASKKDDASLVIIERASHTYNAIHPLVHVPFALSLAAEVSAHFIAAHM